MAIATSLLHQTLRGAVGDLIFRNYNGKTVVSMRPVYKNQSNTEKRRHARGKFREATVFASEAMLDKKLKAYYLQKAKQLKLPNAYTAAITDFLRKAKVTVVSRSGFAAKKNEVVRLIVRKSVFRISRIMVVLYNSAGVAVREDSLSRTDYQRNFAYEFKDDVPDFGWMKIVTDEPENREYIIKSADFKVVPASPFFLKNW